MARILLVEDDANVRVLMEHVLLSERYQVDPAATIEAARVLIGRNRYDLVLADGVLPDGSGIESPVKLSDAVSQQSSHRLRVQLPKGRSRPVRASVEAGAPGRVIAGCGRSAKRIVDGEPL